MTFSQYYENYEKINFFKKLTDFIKINKIYKKQSYLEEF